MMRLKRRKQLVTITLVVLILASMSLIGAADSYHSYINYGMPTKQSGSNVSVIGLVKLGDVSVNAVIVVSPVGSINTQNVVIYFQNGSSYTINSYASDFIFHIHMNKTTPFYNEGMNGGQFNVTLTNSHPIDAGILYNVPLSETQNAFPPASNTYVFYVFGSAIVSISAVGESL